jgi:hypothetical protein
LAFMTYSSTVPRRKEHALGRPHLVPRARFDAFMRLSIRLGREVDGSRIQHAIRFHSPAHVKLIFAC